MKRHLNLSHRVIYCVLIAIFQIAIVLTNNSSSFSQSSWETPPRGTPPAQSPTITLTGDVSDAAGMRVNSNTAPFKIRVRGTVQNAQMFFVYLVVDDSNALHIQPVQSLGPKTDGDFVAYCYLGIQNDPASVNKYYRIFSVVTNKPYSDYSPLDKNTVLAESTAIELFRTR